MQTVYIMDIRPLAPFEEQLALLLQPERLEKMRQYLFQADRLRCLAGGLLLRHAVQNKEISYGNYGKPFQHGGPHFNISHTGDYACLAVSAEAPLGIDIELHKDEDFLTLGKTAFHPEELAFLGENPTAERFYTIWTLKESYAKMSGTGFSVEPSSYCVLPGKMLLPSDAELFFRTFDILDGYTISLCAAEPINAGIEFVEAK